MHSLTTRDFYFLTRLRDEVAVARRKHPSYISLHEAYGVLLEEVAEFFDEVRKQTSARDPQAILAELIQIAAVAQRAATEIPALYNAPKVGTVAPRGPLDVPHGTIPNARVCVVDPDKGTESPWQQMQHVASTIPQSPIPNPQ